MLLTIVSMLRKPGNICCGHKMFLKEIKHFCVSDTNFVSATNVAPAGKRGNICVRNKVSTTLCPRFPPPLRYCSFLFLIIINIRGQIRKCLPQNTRAWRAILNLTSCKRIYCPVTDWFTVHHRMNVNQSGYVYWHGETIQANNLYTVQVKTVSNSFSLSE